MNSLSNHTSPSPTSTALADDLALLPKVVAAVHDAGARLLKGFSSEARPGDRAAMFAAGLRNEERSLDGLRAALSATRPGAQWIEDEQETVALPPGEWWAVDAVEGNVNHVHGLSEWCVSVTLLRDNVPVLTAVYQPIGELTYTAVRGAGAHLNGRPLHVSAKTDLSAAIVTTGQAEAGQEATYRRIGESITAMLSRALLVRASVPSTFPMLLVATGQFDVFWQYEPVLPGVAAGMLLVTEAGGIASDVHGQPWRPGSPDILVTAPALHTAAMAALSLVA
jgi:myo-inositol-1(or 4)-monophosphatase